MFFQKTGIGFCYGLIACFVHALHVLVVPRMPCNFASLARCLAFCIHSISLPATFLCFKHCMLYFSLKILLLSLRALLHTARDVALFSLSSLFSLTLYCIVFLLSLNLGSNVVTIFFSSEANCLLISLINNNNNNNNNNNESLFH